MADDDMISLRELLLSPRVFTSWLVRHFQPITGRLEELSAQLEQVRAQIMSNQEELDVRAARTEGLVSAMVANAADASAKLDALAAEIVALKNQPGAEALDFVSTDKALDDLAAVVATVDQLTPDAPVTPPADPPVEETPPVVETPPVEEAPADPAPVEEAPADPAPVEEAPADPAPADPPAQNI